MLLLITFHLDHFQKLQKCVAELTQGLDRYSYISDMLSELKWLNIKQSQDLHSVILAYTIQKD